MTHRAQLIIDATVVLMAAQDGGKGVKTFAHRGDSLAETQDELPARSVDFGTEEPPESEFLSRFDSDMTMPITGVVSAPTEAEARAALLDLRNDTDVVMDDARLSPVHQKLGLDFIHGIRWGGAPEPPIIETQGELVLAAQTWHWIVSYRVR